MLLIGTFIFDFLYEKSASLEVPIDVLENPFALIASFPTLFSEVAPA
jgi:hypothetical protein